MVSLSTLLKWSSNHKDRCSSKRCVGFIAVGVVGITLQNLWICSWGGFLYVLVIDRESKPAAIVDDVNCWQVVGKLRMPHFLRKLQPKFIS